MKSIKALLFAAIILFFSACTNETSKTTVTTTDSDTMIMTTPPIEKVERQAPAATPPKIDTTAIDKDSTIESYIKKEMKGWSVPNEHTWEQKWYDQYNKGTNKVYKLQADFDGNATTDYAYILQNAASQYAVWAFLKMAEGYQPVKVYGITKIAGKLHAGLGLLPPGTYYDINGEKPVPVTTKTSAIQVIFFGTASKAYYWKNGKFNLVQTGD